MSEERFDRIEQRLDRIEGDVTGMRGEMRVLGEDLRQEMRTLNDETRLEMRTLNEDVRREMRVLHEELIERIAVTAPDFGPIRREFRQADGELREELDRRIQPLEAIAREQARRRRDGDR